ncbi:LysR family transcriptional regulator [Serpentinimonas barnesii]|uniref:LysR family transcriptional regulator n=1 Tax=Serpentinimonas barnesii TaxID=1458427 RepID=UPI000B1352DB|nr:LysR family transcriptional regulator [Serpentinimonas barnesii]
MQPMNDLDWSALDARLLRVLVAVTQSGSVTAAAQRLGVTQSAVSHQLDRLRAIVGDPLFVKSGRGIVATARTEALLAPAQALLQEMERFAQRERFEPAQWEASLTLAANDLQRDLLLPPLLQRLQQLAPKVQLRVIPSGIPSLELLRQQQCQLVLSPRPPDGTDIVQKRLFEDAYRVFYDPAQRAAPRDLDDYLAAEHATVVYEPNRPLDLDQWLLGRGVQRRFRVLVPGFAGLASFLPGSRLLATAPGLLQRHLLRGLASAAPPLPCPPLPMYMVWHLRHQHDPAQRWLREQIEALLPAVLSPPLGAGPPAAAPAGTAVGSGRCGA